MFSLFVRQTLSRRDPEDTAEIFKLVPMVIQGVVGVSYEGGSPVGIGLL